MWGFWQPRKCLPPAFPVPPFSLRDNITSYQLCQNVKGCVFAIRSDGPDAPRPLHSHREQRLPAPPPSGPPSILIIPLPLSRLYNLSFYIILFVYLFCVLRGAQNNNGSWLDEDTSRYKPIDPQNSLFSASFFVLLSIFSYRNGE